MRTDSHIHLFSGGILEPPLPEGDLACYESIRVSSDVGTALVVGYEGQPRFAGNNEYILGLAQQLSWVRPLAFLDVATPPSPDGLEHFSGAGYDGFTLYLPESGPSLDSWPAAQFTRLAQCVDGRILSINASPKAAHRVLPQLRTLAQGGHILISHVGSPGPAANGVSATDAAQMLAPYFALAESSTVMMKLSGLYAIDRQFPHSGASGVVDAVFSRFGARRLVWGSDFSPALAAVSTDQLMELPPWLSTLLSPTEVDDVLNGNLAAALDGSQ